MSIAPPGASARLLGKSESRIGPHSHRGGRLSPEKLARIKRESLAEIRRIILEKYPDLDQDRAERKRKNKRTAA